MVIFVNRITRRIGDLLFALRVNNHFMKNRIRYLRQLQGLTLQQLAERVGCSYQQITRLEHGQRRLSQEWMERIAAAIGCRPAELIEETSLQESGVIPFSQPPHEILANHRIIKSNEGFFLREEQHFGPNAFALEVPDNSMNLSGILKGDIVISSLDSAVKRQDIVILQYYRDADSASTLLRRYDTPLLLPHSTEPGHKSFQENSEAIRIIAPVLKLIRLFN
ncbi:MAG: helix-turn-helix domain-containing protein [Rickettsiales bacterium]|nr:helix-turn-helix domain-containing protein [Rickettsiales bacterium]